MVVCLVDLVKLWPDWANVGQLFFTSVFLVHLQQNAWSTKMKAMSWLEVQRSETSSRSGWTESDPTSRVWLYSGTAVHTGWTFGIDITSVVRLLVKTQYTREHTPSDRAELWRYVSDVQLISRIYLIWNVNVVLLIYPHFLNPFLFLLLTNLLELH